MELKKLPYEYEKALPLLKKIEAAGFEGYFVGGSVRDVLLGQPIHDVDIATSAFPAEIKSIFPRTIDVGIDHGTVLVLVEEEGYEITTFRTESTYQDFRRPDHVEFVRSLEEDLKRRDFTINAFALKEDGAIIDLFGGLEDLNHRILRAVGNPYERFHEDALRMMRGLRFVSQLGFTLEEKTKASIYENHALLAKISIERITIEFVKLLLGQNRRLGISMLIETNCYQYCPGLRGQAKALQAFASLPEKQLENEVQAWTLLIDQLGLTAEDVRPFLKAWRCSNQMIRSVQQAFKGLQWRKKAMYSKMLLYDLKEETILTVESLLPYYGLASQQEEARNAYHKLPIKKLTDLAINGHDLMTEFQKPGGRWLKEALEKCEQSVVEGQIKNKKKSLFDYLKEEQNDLVAL
ncbi:CCA tRNA nucleotidyltransferase [Enterococcus sp. LJL98]